MGVITYLPSHFGVSGACFRVRGGRKSGSRSISDLTRGMRNDLRSRSGDVTFVFTFLLITCRTCVELGESDLPSGRMPNSSLTSTCEDTSKDICMDAGEIFEVENFKENGYLQYVSSESGMKTSV